jgi:hypothetical protein
MAEYRAAMRPRSSAKIGHHAERPFEHVPTYPQVPTLNEQAARHNAVEAGKLHGAPELAQVWDGDTPTFQPDCPHTVNPIDQSYAARRAAGQLFDQR